jgi:hypothetical protein
MFFILKYSKYYDETGIESSERPRFYHPLEACARQRGSLPIAETVADFEEIYQFLNGKSKTV